MKLDQSAKEKIKSKIEAIGGSKACARCGHTNFSILDGFVNIPLSQEISGNIIIGGPQVPCAVIACNQCGNLNLHAIGALGLLNELK